MQIKEHDPSPDYVLSDEDKKHIKSLVAKIRKAAIFMNNLMVVELEELCALLNDDEASQLKRVYTIDPGLSGFKKPKSGIEPIPEDIQVVPPQPFVNKEGGQLTPTQYIPKCAHVAYMQMAKAMEKKIGRKLLIDASYRSSASQAYFFLYILCLNDFDLKSTVQYAAVPGYSEHGTPSNLAFDFRTVDGSPSVNHPEDFEETEEYEWLSRNAYKYDFYLTYPRDNTYGVMFEPWHWRHIPPMDPVN